MGDIAGGIAALVLVVGMFIVAPMIGALIGAFSGWAVGLLFEDTIRGTLRAFGADMTNVSMWQLGATLGFVGGFFKTSVSSK